MIIILNNYLKFFVYYQSILKTAKTDSLSEGQNLDNIWDNQFNFTSWIIPHIFVKYL